MYSDKENINILTAALCACGVRHAVVCPGSRNAPIVSNLNAHPSIICHTVTDERSAGFYALGLSLATKLSPVAVCVTSGTALLNLAPAVAEAYYQHVPLIVVSADRPEQWIGQLDGQTLPQQGAFGRMVRRSVQLIEPHSDEERWCCRRMAMETLYAATLRSAAPVHINVPISEPLFSFTVEALPDVTAYDIYRPFAAEPSIEKLPKSLLQSHRLMVAIGQTMPDTVAETTLMRLARHAAVMRESLGGEAENFDLVLLSMGDNPQLQPDHIIYIGGTIVSKHLKQFLRRSRAATTLLTTDATDTPDPTMHLAHIIECEGADGINRMLDALGEYFEKGSTATSAEHNDGAHTARMAFASAWNEALCDANAYADEFEPAYSQMSAVRYLEQQISKIEPCCHLHYANSSAVRLSNVYAHHHVWCNRGVNGIEGSVSTAAGFSLATSDRVVVVTGDLSFFYDQNALWNAEIGGNLRILLLNNHGGGIFQCVKGLPESGVPMPLVAGQHHTDARGICAQNNIAYAAATEQKEMEEGINQLLSAQNSRPMLLEIFTCSDTDAAQWREFYAQYATKKNQSNN